MIWFILDTGRTAGGYSSGSQGYGSRGRAPAATGGVARGRPAPASQGTYAVSFTHHFIIAP